jgi:hypothetical protein
MKTLHTYRHGEVMLREVEKLPQDLTKAKTKVFMTGSHGHNHSINTGDLYFHKDGEFIFGYLVAKNTSLLHPEHSPNVGDAQIADGVYELRKQQEYTPEGLVPVID